MKLVFSGWGRFVKQKKLVDSDLSRLSVSDPKVIHLGHSYLNMDDSDAVIMTSAENVHLTGNYEVEIRLTRREIANLARVALADEPFGKAVSMLSKKRPAPRK